ncbi:hypothetical protein MNBD_GAMMA06-1422 [hydrothermal vent metagenome]|uniref:Purple acid phosphatase n=1 Tax=hydrothermal vent metagenome TaxID=652676 RepID=A0A3B0XCU1_9ZZZZ
MSLLKNLLKIIILLALTYGVGRFVVVFKDSRLTGERAPYIQTLTSDSVIIHWLTEDAQLGVVRFGEKGKPLSNSKAESSASTNHIVKLTGLKAGTLYYYQAGDVAENNWFYTQPDKAVATRVWVIGDSGQPGDMQNQVRDAAFNWMQENPLGMRENVKSLVDVWLALGDNAYRSGTNQQYQAGLFEPYKKLLSNTALWSVYGNHDDRRWAYFRIFDFPENAEAGGIASNTENYYSFNYSNIHFVMLDSQASDRSKTGEMASWLKRDLTQNKKTWVVAAFHHPPYTKGSHDSDDISDSRGRMQQMRENILPILEAGGVDLVLSGHSHVYERSYLLDCSYGYSDEFSSTNIVSSGVNGKHLQYLKPMVQEGSSKKEESKKNDSVKEHKGAIYVVTGSSSKADQGSLDHPAHHVALSEAGSVVIDVDGNKLIARFINNKGLVHDEFSITKKIEYVGNYQGCNN